ncbi:MAG: magnesium/cobalt transporter CorA [Candidatus Binatia bacterium]
MASSASGATETALRPTEPVSGIINCVAYADGKRVGEVEIEDISEILRFEGQFIWIGLHEPTEDLLRQVQAEFELHDLAVEDAHTAHQRPKLEEYGNSLFVALRTVQRNPETKELEFGETHVFLGARYVVSVRHGSKVSYAGVRGRCEASPQHLKQGPGFVLYAIMDRIVDLYFPVIDELEEDLEALEEDIFSGAMRTQVTQSIYHLKRDLMLLKRAVQPLIEVCNRLVRYDVALIPPETRLYFRDIYDHIVRINESVDNMRELLTAALETNLTLVSVRQNEVMKKLAGWAAMLAVPTAIAGIYGMNFEFMPELRWKYGYPAVMLGMATACSYLYYRFKKAGWF